MGVHAAIASGCPAHDELVAFQLGELLESRLLEIAAHLDTCASCEQAIREVGPASDTLIDLLRQFADSTAVDVEPECARLAAGAKALACDSSAAESAAALLQQQAQRRRWRQKPPPEFLGQYQLQRRLGQGGMGVVYQAQHQRLKRTVAIKVLPESRLGDPGAVQRFYREWEAIGRLEHPQIVQATDAGEAAGFHFLVMEYVDGIDLAKLVRQVGPLSVGQAAEIIRQAALGLQYVGDQGLVHRDIKPSNLMLNREGQVKIMDLGLALLNEEALGGGELTSQNQIMGTADYMAPEQALDSHKVDLRADLYSLGCTLYYLLAGMPPLSGAEFATPMRKLLGHTQGRLPSIAERRADLPAALCDLLGRLLARDPAARPARPAAVAEELAALASAAGLSELVERVRVQTAEETLDGPTEPGFAVGESSDPDARSRATLTAVRMGSRASRRRRLALGGAVALLAGMAGGTIWFYSLSGNSGRGSGAHLPVPAISSDNRLPDLLGPPPPQPLLWPEKSSNSFWNFDQANNLLRVHTSADTLFEYGHTAADTYELSVKIDQFQWNDAGLFVGYHEDRTETPPVIRYQVICFEDARQGIFHFARFEMKSFSTGATGKQYLAGDTSPYNAKGPHKLKLSIRAGALQRVTWDHVALRNLVGPTIDKPIPASDYAGKFGTYNSRCTVDFRDLNFSNAPGN